MPDDDITTLRVGYYLVANRHLDSTLVAGLALLVPALGWLPEAVRTPMGWVGAGMVFAAAILFSSHTEIPGDAALLPVGGAALMVGLEPQGGAAQPGGSGRAVSLLFGLLRGFVLLGVFVILGQLLRLEGEHWWRASTLLPYGESIAKGVRVVVGAGREHGGDVKV